MTVEDDFEVQLSTGLAEYLAAADIGLTWSADGVYAADDTGIMLDAVPPAPDRLVTLTTVLYGRAVTLREVTVNLQVRTRSAPGDPSDVAKLDRVIRNVLVPREGLTLTTGVRIVSIDDGPSARLGQDEHTPSRWMRSHNYPLVVTSPT